jgi:hypothetical protein
MKGELMRRFVSGFLFAVILSYPLVSMAAPAIERAPRSREERLVRAAYAKMAAYNRASYAVPFGRQEAFAGDLAMRFDLRDFQTGRLEDRRTAFVTDLVTVASGEIIHGVVHQMAGAESLAFEAEWKAAPWSSLHDQYLTIGEAMAGETEATFDIGKYTSYEVTVWLEGRSRTYRAMAVFHDRFDPANEFVPEFIDDVVGLGGTLTRLARDSRPAFRAVEPKGLRRATKEEIAAIEGDRGRKFNVAANSECFNDHDEDSIDHNDGGHSLVSRFCHDCTVTIWSESNSYHTCDSQARAEPYESGEVTGLGKHIYAVSTAHTAANSVPLTQDVSCGSATGMVVSECKFFDCGQISATVGVDVKGAQASVTMTSGATNQIWETKTGSAFTCGAQEVESGASPVTKTGSDGGAGPQEDMDQVAEPGCTNYHYWVVWVRVDNVIYVVSVDYLGCD